MTRRVTRLTVDIDGAPKQALKIKEHGHGTLTITCQVGRNFEHGGENRPISDDHYSIHPPDKGRGVLMKRTTRLVDGAKFELATFVHLADGAMVSPIFAKYSQDLSLTQYDLRAGSSDRVISLGSLDPKQQSFIFAVIVSTSNWPMELLRPPHLDFKVVSFDRFTVGIAYSAIGFPSTEYGRYAHLLTSTPRVDEGDYVQLDPIERMLTPAEVATLTTMMLESVGKRQFEHLAEMLPPSESRDWLKGVAAAFRVSTTSRSGP